MSGRRKCAKLLKSLKYFGITPFTTSLTVSAAARDATLVTAFWICVAICSMVGFTLESMASGGCGSSAGPSAGDAVWCPASIAVSGSSLNMWTVDEDEATARKRSSDRKVRHEMTAGRALRRNLYKSCPSVLWKTFTTVPFSDAVATNEPEAFSANAANAVWCAVKTCVARSSCPTCTRTAPVDCPGQHRIHGSLAAANTQRPLELALVVRCMKTRSLSKVYKYMAYSQTIAMMSLRKATPLTSFLDRSSPTNFPFRSSQI
mmetsp:Transcript_32712/g.90315  ORF Transcript_32712/g.90315 Transcript_32712/m.90315 type:complete len:261 (+) Transcript_32712:446-1228(+)